MFLYNMPPKSKEKFSRFITFFIIFIFIPLGIIWNICSTINNKHIKNEILHNGDMTIATIVRKDGTSLTYDVNYNGEFYSDVIDVKRRVMVNTQIGDRFPALILKEKINRHKKGLLFPSYISIILTPLPKDYQGREMEIARIDSMYYNNQLFH